MTELVTATLAIFAGVAIVPWLRRRRVALAGLDGFVVVSIGGLVLVTLLPYSLHEAGLAAAVAAAVGLVLPSLVERQRARSDGSGAATTLLALAGLGLAVHAFLDGAALASADEASAHGHGHGDTLALAVILHRLPMGLVLGLLASSSPRMPWLMAGVVAGATLAGHALGQAALPALGLESLALFQALVAGSLLHVVFAHTPTELQKSERSTRFAGGLGALAGLALTIYFARDHPMVQHSSAELEAFSTLLSMSLEFAPAMVLALLLAGIASAFIRSEQHVYLRGGAAWTRPFRGLISGLPLPISSCGILPIYRSLVEDRVPQSAALAFLIATPQLGIAALLISLPAFGVELTALRVLVAMLATLLISVLIATWLRGTSSAEHKHKHEHEGHHHPDLSAQAPRLHERLREGLRFGLSDLADHLLPWLCCGLVLAALIEPLFPEQLFDRSAWPLEVVVAATLGLPLYVCATGSTPVLAVLLHKALSPGAAIAFLITGPSLNWETFSLARELHGPSRAWLLAGTTLVVAIAMGIGVDLVVLGSFRHPGLPLQHGAAESSWLQQLSLGILLTLAVLSLLRSGARGWLGQLQTRYGEHVHSNVASHHCAHDHGHAHAHSHDS